MLRRAFTLVEVVVVIAIIVVVSAVLAGGIDVLLPSNQRDSPYEVLRKAVDTAWYGAATEHRRLTLRFDAEAGALILSPAGNGSEKRTGGTTGDSADATGADAPNTATAGAAPTGAVFAFGKDDEASVRFLRAPDDGGTLQRTVDTPFARLEFSPWGGSTPAIIELTVGSETFLYRLDPFGGGLEKVK